MSIQSSIFVHENLTNKSQLHQEGKGCVESCNFCVNRIDHGIPTTACEEACMKEGHKAISFGDLSDPNSRVSQALKKNKIEDYALIYH